MSRARRVFSEENKKGFPGFSEKTFPFSARGRSPRTERPKRGPLPCAAFSSMPCSFSAAQSHDASLLLHDDSRASPFPTPETDARIRQAEKPRAAAASRAMRSARRPRTPVLARKRRAGSAPARKSAAEALHGASPARAHRHVFRFLCARRSMITHKRRSTNAPTTQRSTGVPVSGFPWNSPVSVRRNATMRRRSLSDTGMPERYRPITATLSSSVVTVPSCM